MKIFLSIFAFSITVFLFFSLSVAFSWVFYFSATIHKNYMFLFCNGILLLISLNLKHNGQEQDTKKQPTEYNCKSGTMNRTVVEVGNEKELGMLHVAGGDGDDDDDYDDAETVFDVGEESYGHECDEEGAGHDDKTLLVIVEETRDDDDDDEEELEAVKDERTLSPIEETRGDELGMEEEDKTTLLVEESKDDELEDMEDDDMSLIVVEHGDDEQEQGGSIDSISLEELHRKCEEFIRRMKKDIRIETLTVQCY